MEQKHFEQATQNRAHAQVRKASLAVWRALGPNLSEAVYQNALVIELQSTDTPVVREEVREITYRGHCVGYHRFDIVFGACIVEVKKAKTGHAAQLRRYLRLARPGEFVVLAAFTPKGAYTQLWKRNT